ncbi:dihydrosphingosine phosphate lyase [Perilla frutescens var. hirtella]|uniref:Dihydrosphingosine phosphate lyase n=1 Tax=Perilla frutescens var. hirtella TaxID=608512 RepID=A0AAD4JIZ2_PERFH|nr:dihydrosphingosine phosphate lyase [Perilla frutescens var. hirtella]
MSVAAVYFTSLELYSCVNLTTFNTEDDDEEEEAKDHPLMLTSYPSFSSTTLSFASANSSVANLKNPPPAIENLPHADQYSILIIELSAFDNRYPVPPFDFSVRGVTSISVDVHKYGLVPKGTNVTAWFYTGIMTYGSFYYVFSFSFCPVTEWTGGLYVSPTIAGSRPGALIAGAWAAMMSLGLEGYLENTRKIMEASKRIEKGVWQIPELFVVGRPDMTLVAFGSNIDNPRSIHLISKLPRDEDDNRFDPMDSHISFQSESIGV